MEILTLVLVALAIPVSAIAGLGLALALRGRVAELERRLARAEIALAGTARPDLAPTPPETTPAQAPTSRVPEAAGDRPPVAEPAVPPTPPLPEPIATP